MITPTPNGSYDDIDYTPGQYVSHIVLSDGIAIRLGGIPKSLVTLYQEVLEYQANQGHLDPHNIEMDKETGFDGLDELVNDALTFWPNHWPDKEGIEYE